jgi:hypothetical protein
MRHFHADQNRPLWHSKKRKGPRAGVQHEPPPPKDVPPRTCGRLFECVHIDHAQLDTGLISEEGKSLQRPWLIPGVTSSHQVHQGTATITAHGISFGGLRYVCDRALSEEWFSVARLFGSWRVECSYDPALVNEILLFPAEAEPLLAQLAIDDVGLAGCSWPEAEKRITARRN